MDTPQNPQLPNNSPLPNGNIPVPPVINTNNFEIAHHLDDDLLKHLPETKNSFKHSFKDKIIDLKIKVLKFFTKKEKISFTSPEIKPVVKHKKIKQGLNAFERFFISKTQLIEALDQLATLLGSGIRLVDSIIIMKQQEESKFMKQLLSELIESIEGGLVFSDALKKQSNIFPVKWISLIKAGEKSGQLEKVLTELSAEETEQQKIKSALKGAMAYPVFVLCLSFFLLIYMLVKIVPEISDIYNQMNQTLPGPTLFIINLSEFVQTYVLFIFLGITLFFIFTGTLSKYILQVRFFFDWLKLRIPVMGEMQKRQNLVVFSGNLSLLLRSGVLVVDALNIVAEALPSPLYKKELLRIKDGVNTGKRISQEMGLINLQKEQFEKNFYFPLNVSQMIHIGEESGNLVDILLKMKNSYSSKVKLAIKTMSALLEPILIVFVGLTVGGILYAVIIPFFAMGSGA